MKRLICVTAAVLVLAAAVAFAAPGHKGHGSAAHEEVIDGVKTTFTVQTMKDAMNAMGMELPKGVMDTHHISVSFLDVRSAKQLVEGEVKVKIQGPDNREQTRDLTGMQGHFGADFNLSQKGKYGVMSKFKLADGKVRTARFWYIVK